MDKKDTSTSVCEEIPDIHTIGYKNFRPPNRFNYVMRGGKNEKSLFCPMNKGNKNILSVSEDQIKLNRSLSNENEVIFFTSGKNEIKRVRKKRKRQNKQRESNDTSKCKEVKNEYKLTSNDYTVYTEGLPYDCTEESVKDFFASNGCNDIMQLRLPKWQDSGRLRGYGHIVFSTLKSREKALCTIHGKYLNNRYISIQPPKSKVSLTPSYPRIQPKGCVTIFISNLPYDAVEDDVARTIRSCGKIIRGGVRIVRNYRSGHSKGFAYVTFKNPEGAYMAVEKAFKGDVVIGTRTCHIDYDEGIMRNSYKTKEGRLWIKENSR